jgi:hypothetical protein
MTVLDLVKQSLGLSNIIAVGESLNAAVFADAVVSLNMILQSMQNNGLLSFTEKQSFTVVSGTFEYVVGENETWDGNKPLSINSAYIRDSNGTDFEVLVINETDYMKIPTKSTVARPTHITYTNGMVTMYPVPDQSYTITIMSNKPFVEYSGSSGNTEVVLPNGYNQYLVYALAEELMQKNFGEVSQYIQAKSRDAMEAIKRTNLKKPPILTYDNAFSNKRYDPEYDV